MLSRTPPDPAALRWSMATFYEGTLLAPTRAMHGPGILMDVQRGATRVALSFHGRLPYEEVGGGATVRIAAEGFRMSLAAVSFVRPTLLALASLGVGADVTHVRTTIREGDLMAQPGRWTVDPVVRPSVGIEAHRGRWRASVNAGIDVDLIGGHYVTTPATGGTQSVWVPWRWRPYAALAVGLAL